ncbi:hypothetical protein TRVL_06254 [Trypanosoma vivax]|nr:hypothetical protein TRVL_06254 [Trypanosoma vivax]
MCCTALGLSLSPVPVFQHAALPLFPRARFPFALPCHASTLASTFHSQHLLASPCLYFPRSTLPVTPIAIYLPFFTSFLANTFVLAFPAANQRLFLSRQLWLHAIPTTRQPQAKQCCPLRHANKGYYAYQNTFLRVYRPSFYRGLSLSVLRCTVGPRAQLAQSLCNSPCSSCPPCPFALNRIACVANHPLARLSCCFGPATLCPASCLSSLTASLSPRSSNARVNRCCTAPRLETCLGSRLHTPRAALLPFFTPNHPFPPCPAIRRPPFPLAPICRPLPSFSHRPPDLYLCA